ncbi:MAG TPA: DUF5666 domain-containing protein [Thermoanaerobaculia bacterium]|nr:DUF5666 domain-containing protein [Thermoanaerobaculia bacterium]
MGDIFGGNNGNTGNQQQAYELRGTVDSVDLNSRSVYLTNVSGYNSMLSSGGSNGNNVRVYFDDRTPVDYQGRSYRPEDLERGDQVSVRVDESGNRLYATAMSVTYNANTSNNSYPNNSYPNNGSYGTTFRGTVNSVDTSRRTITLDRGYGSYVTVEYDTSTPVYYNNQTYRAADLDRGDEIEIRGTDLGSNRFRASDITVTRNVGNGSYGSSQNTSTLRGTVRYIDTSRRTIELGSTSWMSGFTTGTGSGGTITIGYDPSASVDVQGQLHPVSGLEAGDIIEVQVMNPNSSLPIASRITLIRNARG